MESIVTRLFSYSRVCSLALLTVGLTSTFSVQAASLEQQRTWYEQAQNAFSANDMAVFHQEKTKLGGYALYPYLEYREFNAQLETQNPSQVKVFIEKYKMLPFSQTIKTRYLNQLVSTGRWHDFLAMQPAVPRNTALQCAFYYAKEKTGKTALAWQGAEKLWQTGSSLPAGCDELLNSWNTAGKRTNSMVLDRMVLAYANGNKSLLTYLDKQLTGDAQATGEAVLALYEQPQNVGEFAKKSKVTPFNQALTKNAFLLLARKNTSQAVAEYDQVVSGQHFDKATKQTLADAVASRLMSTTDASLAKWRDSKLAHSHNTSILERRVRNAIREANWKQTQLWIDRLPKEAQQTPRWTFWKAKLLAQNGHKKQADKIYTSLLGERDFYSAAAATILHKPIVYPLTKAPTSTALLTPYKKSLARVDELILLKKTTAANREWGYLLSKITNVQTKRQLAVYAEKHQWHYLAVQATISGKLWDHMTLRFPLAHKWLFDFFSEQRHIPTSTMMALARQESALNIHAQSHVGASGLMQLMPATAAETAKKLDYKYLGKQSLFDPSVNIRLGSAYLKMMLERNDNNRVYAFASYNAGPGRVAQWKKETAGKLDVYAFIEQIPFNETRGYVQNVLMFDIYYNELMGQKAALFSPAELKAHY
ncbi:murein transglycosylase [Photobacterium phosphoreum]|uniref:murein transglycosylase n=1 Tax=Photobacterium phosphoreum TaxID=659 RepID=UPI000D16E052|nr:murein transglycosylase [Photobacterium phosphoreum]PSW12082.1 murein transglycosylase [Photobacterium phosphoreum]